MALFIGKCLFDWYLICGVLAVEWWFGVVRCGAVLGQQVAGLKQFSLSKIQFPLSKLYTFVA